MALNTKHVFGNKFYGHIRRAISASGTSIVLYPEEITNLLAGWEASSWLYLTIFDETANKEVVKVTAISGETLTVERGQGGTTARTWSSGSVISCRPVAEYLTRFRQQGVYRTGAYNPNGVLSGEYTGEKFYQTGPDAAQRRWWINTTGRRWRLLTGTEFTGEYQRSTSTYWYDLQDFTSCAPTFGDLSYMQQILEHDGDIFGITAFMFGGGGSLLRWNGVDAWIEVAPQNAAALLTAAKSCPLGLFAINYNGKLLKWNEVDAWDVVANTFGEDYIASELQYYDGKLYAIGNNKNLKVWNGVNDWDVDPNNPPNGIYSIDPYYGWGDSIFPFNGKMYGVNGLTPYNIYEFDGTNWTKVIDGVGYGFSAMVEYDSELYGVTTYGDLYLLDPSAGQATQVAPRVASTSGYRIGNIGSDSTGIYGKTYSQGVYKWDETEWVKVYTSPEVSMGAFITTDLGYFYWVNVGDGTLYEALGGIEW